MSNKQNDSINEMINEALPLVYSENFKESCGSFAKYELLGPGISREYEQSSYDRTPHIDVLDLNKAYFFGTVSGVATGRREERERIIRELGLKIRGPLTTLSVDFLLDVIGEDGPRMYESL